MSPEPDAAPSHSSDATLPSAGRIHQLRPDRIRIVEIEDTASDIVVRHDCHDPEEQLDDGDLKGVRSVFRLVNGEICVRAIDWARSSSLNPSVEFRWTCTGIRVEDVDHIRVYTWPEGELSQVFTHME